MPSYRDHLLFGAVVVLAFSTVVGATFRFDLETIVVSTAFILLASVFPDVDHRGSVVHRKAKSLLVVVVSTAAAWLTYPRPGLMLGAALVTGSGTFLAATLLKPRHRTVTHTVQAAVVFAAAVGLFSHALFSTLLPAVFAFLAYCSHLVLDGTLQLR